MDVFAFREELVVEYERFSRSFAQETRPALSESTRSTSYSVAVSSTSRPATLTRRSS